MSVLKSVSLPLLRLARPEVVFAVLAMLSFELHYHSLQQL